MVEPILIDPDYTFGVHVLPGFVIDAQLPHGTDLHINVRQLTVLHLPHVPNHPMIRKGKDKPFPFHLILRLARIHPLPIRPPVIPDHIAASTHWVLGVTSGQDARTLEEGDKHRKVVLLIWIEVAYAGTTQSLHIQGMREEDGPTLIVGGR